MTALEPAERKAVAEIAAMGLPEPVKTGYISALRGMNVFADAALRELH